MRLWYIQSLFPLSYSINFYDWKDGNHTQNPEQLQDTHHMQLRCDFVTTNEVIPGLSVWLQDGEGQPRHQILKNNYWNQFCVLPLKVCILGS